MLSEVFWVIFGGLVGWIAAILRNEHSPKRILIFIAAGMLGGFLGGYAGGMLGSETLEYNASADGMTFAIFGAVALVLAAGLANDKHSE